MAELALDLAGSSFLRSPGPGLQRLQAVDLLELSTGDFGGVEGRATEIRFGNGFRGDSDSVWGH